ncbi:MAG: endolytic transglycosylase MltG [Lewinellaceae bacterium]|nr:endolytic transglycosylase MltG [Lewinella sp.]MCB9278518.1 endolytic transglycosylase MltG [Lewinellaceae bacterium]
MSKIVRLSLLILLAALILGGAYLYYRFVASSAVPPRSEPYYVEIPTGSDFEEVVKLLKDGGMIKDEGVFRWLADKMQYQKDPMRSGRFRIEPGWSMIDLIRHLRNGKQDPVQVVLTTEREPENVAAKAARFIEPDSLELAALFKDIPYIQSLGYTPETLMSLFIPNTYEFYWNTRPREFVDRMVKEHKKFWDQDRRKEKAAALGLTPAEVYTLASIVEKETLQNSEKKRMAGVYLNRLKLGMPLQADPTCVFATRDFNTKRVTDYHTKFDSPYNTYLYKGLPPGPIAMASISSLDAVLNAEQHDYIFFCAKGDGSGLHSFAKTLAAHNKNVEIYRENLRKQGLR